MSLKPSRPEALSLSCWLTRLRFCAGACLVLAVLSFLYWDEAVVSALGAWPHPWLRAFFNLVNELGDPTFSLWLWPFCLLVAWYRPYGHERLLALSRYLALGLPLIIFSGSLLKFIFGRPRPPLFLQGESSSFTWFQLASDHSSMPSGHSTRAFCLAVALGAAYPRLRVPAFCLAALVALGRVMVLRHYPSDVLAGAALAILLMSFVRQYLSKGQPDAKASFTGPA